MLWKTRKRVNGEGRNELCNPQSAGLEMMGDRTLKYVDCEDGKNFDHDGWREGGKGNDEGKIT